MTARGAAPDPSHIGFGINFINEYELFGVQLGLARSPVFARFGDIAAILFDPPLTISPRSKSIKQRFFPPDPRLRLFRAADAVKRRTSDSSCGTALT